MLYPRFYYYESQYTTDCCILEGNLLLSKVPASSSSMFERVPDSILAPSTTNHSDLYNILVVLLSKYYDAQYTTIRCGNCICSNAEKNTRCARSGFYYGNICSVAGFFSPNVVMYATLLLLIFWTPRVVTKNANFSLFRHIKQLLLVTLCDATAGIGNSKVGCCRRRHCRRHCMKEET